MHDTYIEYNIIGIDGHLLEHILVRNLPIKESLHAILTVEVLRCYDVLHVTSCEGTCAY